MHQRTSTSPLIEPLPMEHSPELQEQFEAMRKKSRLCSEQHFDHAANIGAKSKLSKSSV
jgi:hypothetical protein